ncbi:MAG: hypothetical protein ACK2UO_05080, partial [Caldilineaceae bacterium]
MVLIVLLVLMLSNGAGRASAQSVSAGPQLGFHIPAGDATHMKAAHDAGASFVVVVFSWRDIEPAQGSFYWMEPDAVMRAAKYYGLDVVARLDRPPDWARTPNEAVPWNLDSYADFVGRITDRYGKDLGGVIIWNEPNLALEWDGRRPDPAAYLALLSTGYAAVKRRTNDLPVAMAGLAFTLSDDATAQNDLSYLRNLLELGAGAYFDAVALHAYGFGQPHYETPDPNVLNFRRLELHRELLDEFGLVDTRAWITEAGWRTSAPDDNDAWQVVSEAQQATYSLGALDWSRANYLWLERFAFWELNAGSDEYGYALWRGTAGSTIFYDELVSAARVSGSAGANQRVASTTAAEESKTEVIEVLAEDAIVRLGTISTLHPHWVHMYRSDGDTSESWRGEFFVNDVIAAKYTLILETMQVGEPGNQVLINGVHIGDLATRAMPDPTSTWVTQRMPIPAELLRTGPNEVEVRVGFRNPSLQFGWWRHENLQLRNVRIASSVSQALPPALQWRAVAAPGSWAEVIRLRAERDDAGRVENIWLTTNRNGGLWSAASRNGDGGTLQFHNEAANLRDKLIVDVLATESGLVAATDEGIFVRYRDNDSWSRAPNSPIGYVHFVIRAGETIYAGLEAKGVWQWDKSSIRWVQTGLDGL